MEDRTIPTDIRQASPTELQITWKDGHVSVYPVLLLRRACRCAACIDEWSGKPILDPEKVPQDVKPVTIEPVGNYAIHIAWSDGHTSGIYSFDHLRGLSQPESTDPS